MITGAIHEAPAVKQGKKGNNNTLSPEIDMGSLRTFEKEYTTAFQRVGRKARGELNMIHNVMGGLNDQARALTQRVAASANNKVIKPVKAKAGVQINSIKDVWNTYIAKTARKTCRD